jgi:molybdopterin converting factor small subunit
VAAVTEVRVRVPSALRELAGGAASVTVAVDGGATVGGVLDALARIHPALERRVRDESGQLRAHVNVFVGAENARDHGGQDAPVPAGGELSILPAVSGGV